MFENKSQSPEETTLRALLALKEWENAQAPRISTNTPSLRPPHQHLHRSREDSPFNNQEIYCNTDAAWISTSRTAGLAWIFSDRNQTELDRGSKVHAWVKPLQSEKLSSTLLLKTTLQPVSDQIPKCLSKQSPLAGIRRNSTEFSPTSTRFLSLHLLPLIVVVSFSPQGPIMG